MRNSNNNLKDCSQQVENSKWNPELVRLNLIVIIFLELVAINFVSAQVVDFGVGISPDAFISEKEEKKVPVKDPFYRELASQFSLKEDDLQKIAWRGYGYTELIKLVLISDKTKKSLPDLIKQRDKGARLSKISQDNKIDYSILSVEANSIKTKIMTELAVKTTSTIMISTDILKMDTTKQLEVDTTAPIKVK